MQLIDGQPVFSATDLVGYLACEHLTALERAALADLVNRPTREDRELDVIRQRGFQHEARFLADLRAEGRSVIEVIRDDEADRGDQIRRQADDTINAMASGAEVIFQATFFDGRWLGYADFLLRTESPDRASVWGPYHYEVADTKLARHVKAGAVLQICSYVEQLTRIQGVQPEQMRVVLGGSARETATLRVDDYMAYFRAARARFEATVLGTKSAPAPAAAYPPPTTYPEPVEHCDVCRWAELCQLRRRADDHLSLVAGITARQRKALVARELDTVQRLAAAPIPFDPPLDGTSANSVERVREQARIQVEGRGLAKPIHELLPRPGEPIEPERGLATLPPPDPGDLFLDLEGDPYALDDGVDYLFGVMDVDERFTGFWSFDPDEPSEVTLAGEKRAFERLIDLIVERHARNPQLHVYHYASYEPTALKRLMGRHGTREEEVDRLLRGGVLVDLFRAVRQGLRASVESYSIKKIEALYDFQRAEGLRDAGTSIVEFESWLQLSDVDRPGSDILASIEAYNRDDVLSTLRLRDWLELERVALAEQSGQEVPRPAARSPDAPEQLREADARVALVAERLTDGVPEDATARTEDERAKWLLAQLLSWHRREAKVAFWDFFNRMGMDLPELTADKEALGPLELVGRVGEPFKPTQRAKFLRQRWRYRFAPQDHDVGADSDLYDPRKYRAAPDAKWSTWKVPAENLVVDEAESVVELDLPAGGNAEHPEVLVPMNIYGDREQRAALLRLGEWVAANGIDAPGAYRAARDLLLVRPPSIGQADGEPLRGSVETELDAARRIVDRLEATTLAIQGPPGAGKTYTGARMIARLLAAGKRVGITANSHKVIGGLLREVLVAASGVVDVRPVQKVTDLDDALDDPRVTVETKNDKVQAGLSTGTYNLAAGTPWLWAPDGSAGIVDVLFVDEAGQMALANALAVAGAAESIVLLGDPQQLDQPLQGSHPPGADRSALAHMLGDHDAMPEHLGLFLEHTWRLHPDVTTYTSQAFYEGKLESRPELGRQRLLAPEPIGGTGVRLLPIEHVGAESESPEEARQVAALVRALVESGSTWIDAKGDERALGYEDILIVAPYNAQVGAILRELPNARVGTVDKFQGQEAPISIYSMTSSSPEDAPRGMDFLYSRNRLNVATSRARCVAVVVASPALLSVRARTPKQMRLANALCQFAELSARPDGSSESTAADQQDAQISALA
jgi:uncharacterized protein